MTAGIPQITKSFDFVDDQILRENLEQTALHILNLQVLIVFGAYGEEERSIFRKTTIIYTAAQIEALLLWYLKQYKTEEECAPVERTFRIDQTIHWVTDYKRLVYGTDVYKRRKFKFQNVNLAQLVHLCRNFELIPNTLAERAQEVRKLRNRQHLGGLETVDTDYSDDDVAYALKVSEEVILYVKG